MTGKHTEMEVTQMLTQIIEGDIMLSKLDDIVMRNGETNRIIIFRLWDGKGEAITSDDYSMEFILQKPDGNFVIQTLGSITDGFYLHTTEQMSVVCGRGYYTLRISDNDDLIYTAHGGVIIDDNTLSDSEIESISEVNGLRFPDDFLTTDSPVALIDDGIPANDRVWSSDKTYNYVISEVGAMIDDGSIIDNKTWSSYKINNLISSTQNYSTTEHIIGKWIDGSNLYAKTYTISVNNPPSTYTEQIDVTGLNIVNIEKHLAEYLYNNVWYYLVGDSLTYNNSEYLHLQYHGEQKNILDLASHLGAVSEIRLCFTLIYTK